MKAKCNSYIVTRYNDPPETVQEIVTLLLNPINYDQGELEDMKDSTRALQDTVCNLINCLAEKGVLNSDDLTDIFNVPIELLP